MQPKTFRAPSTQAALELVQNELGPEAVILSVRQVPGGAAWEAWKRPEVEILALPASSSSYPSTQAGDTIPKDNDSPLNFASAFPTHPTATRSKRTEQPSPDIQAYLTQLAAQLAMQKAPGNPAVHKAAEKVIAEKKPQIPPALIKARSQLLDQGLNADLIKEIFTRLSETANPKLFLDEVRLRQVLKKHLETHLRVLRIERAKSGVKSIAKVIFVIGPSGSGKTSFCARLATFMQKEHQKQIAWVCADTIRTGAIAQTQAYAEALGIQPFFAYTPSDLKDAIEQSQDADIILVDTPARNPYAPQEIIELSAYLTLSPKRITFLTLPASAKEADLQQAVAAFSPLNINGFVFTKLDETRQYGNLFNLVWKSKIPFAYYCDGTHILDNLHPAEASHLVNLILPEG
ncbi:MAG: hypothetical protein ACOY16_05185 [Chloroflexota bacterium]